MNEERDKFLTEAMGKCWHEWYWDSKERINKCQKCNIVYWDWAKSFGRPNYEFSTWKDFGILWEWASKQYWWKKFVSWDYEKRWDADRREKDNWWYLDLINPDFFANALYEFMKGK